MRRRNRSTNEQYLLFNPTSVLGWTVIRRIGFDDGERQVELGVARRVNSDDGRHIGYQRCEPGESTLDVIKPAIPSSTAFSRAEADAIACSKWRGHRSRTVNLTEEQRMKRMHPVTKRLLPAEDFTERALQKMKVYPAVH
jgi:hypothetical protein